MAAAAPEGRGTRRLRAIWGLATSPAVFAVLALLWCLDLGAGSLFAYRRPDLFGAMDAHSFGLWLALVGRKILPHSLWVYLLAILSWMMTASLLVCTVDWFTRRRAPGRGWGEVLVHLGFLLVFGGYVAGSIGGDRVQGILIPQGERREVAGLGIALRLHRLELLGDGRGAVSEGVSHLALEEGGTEEPPVPVRLNHPLIRRSLVVYPRGSADLVGGADLLVAGEGEIRLTPGGQQRLRDGRILAVRNLVQEGERLGPWTGPGLLVTLADPEGTFLSSAYLGVTAAAADLSGVRLALRSLVPVRVGRYDVHRDPGIRWVLAGALSILAGSLLALVSYFGIRRGAEGEVGQ